MDGEKQLSLNMRLRMSFSQWRWLLEFLLACNSRTNKLNGDHILRLSLLSRQVMEEWLLEDNLDDFHWRRSGKLIIHRRPQDLAKAAKGINPQFQQALSREECVHLEPALKHIGHSLCGGIYSPAMKRRTAISSARHYLPNLMPAQIFRYKPIVKFCS